jgi:NAD(P)-dependent dehydrogenase (short-subunit alcohol dehydrogenase family)
MELGLAGATVWVQGFTQPRVRLAKYTAAKAALNSITKNLSLELAPDGILANVVSPGTTGANLKVDGGSSFYV